METPVSSFLLTVDEAPESLWPIDFLAGLYSRLDQVGVLACYFYPPLAPVYQQQPLAPTMAAKKEELLRTRQEAAQAILFKARQALLDAGVPAENIQEYLEERSVSEALHSCSLAAIKRVDGVLLQKATSSKLEGFLRGDPIPAHLQHCMASPVWFLEGKHINSRRAVICMNHEEASLRAVRHAASMLAASGTHIELLHCDPRLNWEITCEADGDLGQLRSWEHTPNAQSLWPYLQKALGILTETGIPSTHIRIAILPARGDVAGRILGYCRENDVGIAVLGHSKPLGLWGFLQSSVTRKILAEFRNMAIWVVQQGTGNTDEDSCC